MSREITKLKHLVDAGVFDVDINYIRPVTATRMSVLGTFDEYDMFTLFVKLILLIFFIAIKSLIHMISIKSFWTFFLHNFQIFRDDTRRSFIFKI